MSPAHVGKKLRNLAMKGSREIILELYVGSSEKLFFFNERSRNMLLLMGKMDEKEELAMRKSTGITERGKPCEGDRDCEPG